MSALTILLVRHGEKPGGDFPGPGLNEAGEQDEKSLIVRGWQRAGAWASLFAAGPNDYPRPNVVYAAAPKPISKKADYSHRPFETAGPTAARFNFKVQARWGVGQETELVEEITKLTGIVLVFWEHKTICGSIIPALCRDQRIPGVPLKWDSDRFDIILRFDRAVPDAPWSFRQLSPRPLSGDKDTPFKNCQR